MAKVTIDESLCTGCGLCENSCEDVFKIEGDVAKVITDSPSCSCDMSQVAEDCPVSAIKVEE